MAMVGPRGSCIVCRLIRNENSKLKSLSGIAGDSWCPWELVNFNLEGTFHCSRTHPDLTCAACESIPELPASGRPCVARRVATKDSGQEKALTEPGAPGTGEHPTREQPSPHPGRWHLPRQGAGLAAVHKRGLAPGLLRGAHTNPGRAETGNVCTADRLSPLLPPPRQRAGKEHTCLWFKLGPGPSFDRRGPSIYL